MLWGTRPSAREPRGPSVPTTALRGSVQSGTITDKAAVSSRGQCPRATRLCPPGVWSVQLLGAQSTLLWGGPAVPLSERTGRELASLPLATMCAATRRLSHSGRRHAGLEVASSAWLQLVVCGDTEQLFTCRLSPVCRDRRFVSAHSHAGPASSPPPAAHRRLRGFLCRASYRGTRSTEGGLPRSRRQQAGAPPGPGVWSCQSKGQLVPRRPACALEPIPPSQGGRPPQM